MLIVLPFPPSVNSLFGGGSKQKRFPSKAYKAWIISCPDLYPHMFDGIELTYSYYFPDKRERDTENYVKAVSDLLVKKNVIANDSWLNIHKMTIIPMGVDKLNPRVEIEIK